MGGIRVEGGAGAGVHEAVVDGPAVMAAGSSEPGLFGSTYPVTTMREHWHFYRFLHRLSRRGPFPTVPINIRNPVVGNIGTDKILGMLNHREPRGALAAAEGLDRLGYPSQVRSLLERYAGSEDQDMMHQYAEVTINLGLMEEGRSACYRGEGGQATVWARNTGDYVLDGSRHWKGLGVLL